MSVNSPLGLESGVVRDIIAGYDDPGLLPKIIAALVDAGYIHRGEQGIAGRECFRRGNPRAYHIHLVRRDEQFGKVHLRFRDALRANATLRDEHAALKTALAERCPRAYITGKGEFVTAILK